MSTFEVPPRHQKSIKLLYLLAALVVGLLLLGSGVEISLFYNYASTIKAVENERDLLRTENNVLRKVVLTKLDSQAILMKKQGDDIWKQSNKIEALEKWLKGPSKQSL